MKKNIICLTLLSFLVFNLAARDGAVNSKKTVEIITDVAGIPSEEQSWLGVSAADKLESNLFPYANFIFINSINKKQILDIQRKSEGAAYNEDTAIQVGNLSQARYGLFLTIKKGGSKYNVTVRFTDLTTGETLATVNGICNSPEELFAIKGSVIDKLTIELCDALNIPLSHTEKQFIMNGDRDLSSDEKAIIYEERIQLFEEQIADINKKIDYWSISSDVDAISLTEKLETEKKLANEQLQVAKKNQRRAEEEAKRRKEDEMRNAKRSAQQKEKINELSSDLQEKYKTLRSKKLDHEPILGKIKIIELKKKALLDYQTYVDNAINDFNQQANKEINDRLEYYKNKPIDVVEQGETADTLSDDAKANRARDFEKDKAKIVEEFKKDADHLNDKLIKETKGLLNEIHKDYNSLKNITVSSLSNDLVVEYGNYDGNKGGWPLFITVKSDDIIIFNTISFLPYKELSGKDPIRDSRDPNYEDFASDVDTYESLFLRREPILTYEIEYSVSPYSPEYPSKYKFKFNYLKYYDTRYMSVWGNKLRSSKTGFLNLNNNSVSRQLSPAYNIRAIEEKQTSSIKIDDVAYDVSPEQKKEKSYDFSNFTEEDYFNYDYSADSKYSEPAKKDVKEKKEKQKEDTENYFRSHSLFGVNLGFGMGGLEGLSVEAEIDVGIFDFAYCGISSTVFFPKKAPGYDVIPDITLLSTNQVKLGINLDLFFCNFYGSVGAGANYFTYIPSMSSGTMVVPDEIPNDFKFIYTIEVGASLPLSKYFAISCGYMMVFGEKEFESYENLDFGIALTF